MAAHTDVDGLWLFLGVLGLGTLALACGLLAVFVAFFLPNFIRATIGRAPLDKLVVCHDLTILKFTETGVDLRVALHVLETKLPWSWLSAGIAAPTVFISHVTGPDTSVPLAKVALSDPIVITGKSDLWVRQKRVVVTVLNSKNVKAVLRRIFVQKSVSGISIKVNLNASIQLMGRVILSKVPLEKIIDLEHSQAETQKALATYLDSQKLKPQTSIKEEKKILETPASSSAAAAAEELVIPPVTSSSSGENATASQSSTLSPNPAPESLERLPHESLLPGLEISQLPIESTMTSFSTGLVLQFSKPPPLGLRLGSVGFDVQLNGSTFASGVVTGVHLHKRTKRVPWCPAQCKACCRRRGGFLQGALNGAVSGLAGGEWGSGAAVVRITNVTVTESHGKEVKWLDEVLQAVELEHDLDAVRLLGGAARDAAKDVVESVLSILQGLPTQLASAVGASVAAAGSAGVGGVVGAGGATEAAAGIFFSIKKE
ncbi:hypothetical protein DFJ73DRAFT_958134 [Zopfochytrium polystomum]|nr:hypothetical protein DFJ73DRAFT_958134 [Zopfochytrium polystomum]